MTGDSARTVAALPAGQPGDRPPAPPGLALVQAFLNTTDREAGIDALIDLDGLGAWLDDHGFPATSGSLREGDRRRLVTFREALRSVIAGRDHGAVDQAALVTVNDAASEAALTVRLDGQGVAALEPAVTGLDALVAQVLGDIAAAGRDGTWSRLKVCPRLPCGWAFYDASKNRSGRWCAMSICGGRTKSARARSRRAGRA
jgi:predicted RNA-binding Zn ribbon-like protein